MGAIERRCSLSDAAAQGPQTCRRRRVPISVGRRPLFRSRRIKDRSSSRTPIDFVSALATSAFRSSPDDASIGLERRRLSVRWARSSAAAPCPMRRRWVPKPAAVAAARSPSGAGSPFPIETDQRPVVVSDADRSPARSFDFVSALATSAAFRSVSDASMAPPCPTRRRRATEPAATAAAESRSPSGADSDADRSPARSIDSDDDESRTLSERSSVRPEALSTLRDRYVAQARTKPRPSCRSSSGDRVLSWLPPPIRDRGRPAARHDGRRPSRAADRHRAGRERFVHRAPRRTRLSFPPSGTDDIPHGRGSAFLRLGFRLRGVQP